MDNLKELLCVLYKNKEKASDSMKEIVMVESLETGRLFVYEVGASK